MAEQRCNAHLRPGIRCQKRNHHEGWHEARRGQSHARWLSEGSYETSEPTKRTAV